MKIINKQFKLDKPKTITVEYIEQYIHNSGFVPLRWAIVKADKTSLLIDAAVQSAISEK